MNLRQVTDKLTDLDQKTFDNTVNILQNTNDISCLGKYQLDLLSKVYVQAYTLDNIVHKIGETTPSLMVYDDFTKWQKENKISDEIRKYFTCPIFVKYFSDFYQSKRVSTGKNWLDIQLKNVNGENSIIKTVSFNMDTLLSVVAFGHQFIDVEYDNIKETIHKQYKTTYSADKFNYYSNDNNNMYLNYSKNTCDLFKPIKLIISGDLTEINKLISIKIHLNDNLIYTLYYFDLLLYTNVLEQSIDKIVLNISELPYFQAHSTLSTIMIETTKKTNLNIFLMSEGIYLEGSEIRRKFKTEKNVQLIRDFYKFEPLTINKETKKIMFEFNNTGGLSKGLFIKCNVNELTYIILSLNDMSLIEYDAFMIDNFCKKISDELLYVPFNNLYNFSDHSKESYTTGICFSKIYKNIITLTFSNGQDNARIYTDSFNCLEASSFYMIPDHTLQCDLSRQYNLMYIDGVINKNLL